MPSAATSSRSTSPRISTRVASLPPEGGVAKAAGNTADRSISGSGCCPPDMPDVIALDGEVGDKFYDDFRPRHRGSARCQGAAAQQPRRLCRQRARGVARSARARHEHAGSSPARAATRPAPTSSSPASRARPTANSACTRSRPRSPTTCSPRPRLATSSSAQHVRRASRRSSSRCSTRRPRTSTCSRLRADRHGGQSRRTECKLAGRRSAGPAAAPNPSPAPEGGAGRLRPSRPPQHRERGAAHPEVRRRPLGERARRRHAAGRAPRRPGRASSTRSGCPPARWRTPPPSAPRSSRPAAAATSPAS